VKHLRYIKYITRHRWFVFIACCKLGIPWLGLIHDLSKYRPSEWLPYANYFYGNNSAKNQAANKNKRPEIVDDAAFDYAWLLHQKRNKHHWQFWMLPKDDGSNRFLPMPEKYVKEMIADWTGAGMAIVGRKDWRPWYESNKNVIQLHPDTRARIEREL
jgi:hypothetical protein